MCCSCFRETRKACFVTISPLPRCHALSSMHQFWCLVSHVVELIIHAITELNQFKGFAAIGGQRTFSVVLSYRPYSIVSINVLTQCDVTAVSSMSPCDITLSALTNDVVSNFCHLVAPSFEFFSHQIRWPSTGLYCRLDINNSALNTTQSMHIRCENLIRNDCEC